MSRNARPDRRFESGGPEQEAQKFAYSDIFIIMHINCRQQQSFYPVTSYPIHMKPAVPYKLHPIILIIAIPSIFIVHSHRSAQTNTFTCTCMYCVCLQVSADTCTCETVFTHSIMLDTYLAYHQQQHSSVTLPARQSEH